MTLNYSGVVDSEDGLLLFGDAGILQQWRGLDNEQVQLDRVTASIGQRQPGLNIPIGISTGVIWNLEGPGTTDVFCNESADTIVLIRSWIEDPKSAVENVIALNSAPPVLNVPFAEFDIVSGFLAIIWSAENGECIHNVGQINYVLSVHDMMTENSGILLPVLNGRYRCFSDTVVTEGEEARRCHIFRTL